MEDIYTIKVKTRPDPRGLYPSERRYSASTVCGLAWVHVALAATSFLLACLALVSPGTHQNVTYLNLNLTLDLPTPEYGVNEENNNTAPAQSVADSCISLVISPCLLSLGASLCGIAAILASTRWYVDQNITWLFLTSIFSTFLSTIAFCMIAVWIGTVNDSPLQFAEFYKDKVPFEGDFEGDGQEFLSIDNSTLYYLVKVPVDSFQHINDTSYQHISSNRLLTKRMLSINILIAAFLELIWSLLSVRVAWRGMRMHYPEDENLEHRGGNRTEVVTKIKGNNTKHLPRNTKILPPKPDLINHYPKNSKIKKIFLTQNADGGFFLQTKNPNMVAPKENVLEFAPKESNSEYRERMFNFLNKCVSYDMDCVESSDAGCESNNANAEIAPINKMSSSTSLELVNEVGNETPSSDPMPTEEEGRISKLSWGDSHDHTIYDQNTLNLDNLLKFRYDKGIKENPVENETKLQNIKEMEDIEEGVTNELIIDNVSCNKAINDSTVNDKLVTKIGENAGVSASESVKSTTGINADHNTNCENGISVSEECSETHN